MNKQTKFDLTKNEQAGLAWAELLNDLDADLLAESSQPQLSPARRGHSWYKGLAAVLALALLLSCSSLAWAVNSLKQQNNEFYLRYITPDMLALDTDSSEDITQQPERIFAALASDDMYYQYIAINRLVELYNEPDLRARAVKELQPFLQSSEPKLADAAAFALDILQDDFSDPRLCHMADGRIFFTLYNDYSDYGSYNQIWQIMDGELTRYTSFLEPLYYIKELLPSPDGRLLAVTLSSNKSYFALVIDAENGYVSSELLGSARALWASRLAQQGVVNRSAVIRIDHETYNGCQDLRWLDNTTLGFTAHLCYDDGDTPDYDSCEIVDSVEVSYNYPTRQFSFTPLE